MCRFWFEREKIRKMMLRAGLIGTNNKERSRRRRIDAEEDIKEIRLEKTGL